MSPAPLVSIALPAYNAEKTLSRAVCSIQLQTLADWELILIDDGSTDGTASVASGFNDPRIVVVSGRTKQGLAMRLNQALSMARGDFFARLDADDIACPERLQRQVEFLQQHREVDLVGTGAVVFASDGSAAGLFPVRVTHEEICRHPWSGFLLAHPTWMGKTAWFRKHQYRADMAKAQDQDLLLRSYRTSVFACLPEALTGYAQERLSLGKILASRYYFSRAVIREAWRNGQYLAGIYGLGGQVAKGAIDAFAILTGLERILLQHRALPISDAEIAKWKRCWAACTKGAVI